MKKKSIKYLIISCIATAVAGYMTACGGNRTPDLSTLSVPENVKFSIEYENNQTKWLLHWETVENAKGYEITVVETEKSYFVEEQASVYDLTSVLDKAGNYNLSIQAIGNGRNTEDSEKVTIEINAESVTESLEYTYDSKIDGYEISKGTADLKGRLVLPDSYDGEKVVSIGEGAFGGVSSLNGFVPQAKTTEVRLPNGLKEIKEKAFFYCENLQAIELPNALETIDESAFQYCFKIENVVIPSSVNKIGSRAFSKATELKSVSVLSDGIIIDDYAFSSCGNLENFTVGRSVKYMGESVLKETKWYENQPNGFLYCGNVLYGYKGEMPVGTEISELPSYITTMAKKAFYSCKNLKSIQIPSGWTSLGGEMIFSFCQGLEEVILPDGMMEIPSDTFMGCSALKRLNEPNSLKKIGDRAFSYCINLEAFAFSGELEEIGDGAFDGCETLKEITFNGTKAQWNAIAKGYNWTLNTLATVVHCTDGDVEI